ncbi:hypothetical protein M8C21_008983, partial [Ambrosia artemisiifolia]
VDAKKPSFWSRVCLHNMANLGKEATTMRRVLESLFRYFDSENLWPFPQGVAYPVLKDMQTIMDESGHNTHFLLSILVKHLDHKNVLKKPEMQLDIIEVTTSLAHETKKEASVAIVGAITDVIRHLRKSVHLALDDADLGDDVIKWNKKFHEVVDECLVELSSKVGDASPIFDIMAGMMENLSSITVIARTTVAAVYRTAQIVASLPNMAYNNKASRHTYIYAFPEALFHQLLPAMVHEDHETRVGSHRIFSVVLVPSSVCPQSSSLVPAGADPNKAMVPRSLSRTVSVFSSSAALFGKMKKGGPLMTNNASQQKANNNGAFNRMKSSYSRTYSIKIDANTASNLTKNGEAVTLRLSSHQISLLLSSIWAQSISPENTPENYEAIAHTYSLVLLFSRAKNSGREALVRSFQLAFSLLDIALAEGGPLSPSHRRSLYTLATTMIIVSGKAFSIVPLVAVAKATLANKMVDPYLSLVEDCKLTVGPGSANIGFGSKEDDNSALKSLSEIKFSEEQSMESLASTIVKHLESVSESEISSIKEQLLDRFVPDDDVCPIGSPCANPPQKNSAHCKSMEEDAPLFFMDDDFDDPFESTNRLSVATAETNDLLSVNQLLDSQAGHPFLEQNLTPVMNGPARTSCAAEYQHIPQSFRLPASSPYDNFLKAARS